MQNRHCEDVCVDICSKGVEILSFVKNSNESQHMSVFVHVRVYCHVFVFTKQYRSS
jgi:hypothetical protein